MTLQFSVFMKRRNLDVFKKCTSLVNLSGFQIRLLSVASNEKEEHTKGNALGNKVLRKLKSSEVYSNSNNESFMDLRVFLGKKRTNTTRYSFVGDEDVARKIVNHIKTELQNGEVIEVNPGLGLITYFLLKENIKNLVIYEGKSKVISSFNSAVCNKKETLKIKYKSILSFEAKSRENLKNLIHNSHAEGKPTKVIATVSCNSFVTNLVNVVVGNHLWTEINNLEFYLLLTEPLFFYLRDPPPTKGKFYFHCILNFLYNIKVIDEFPDSSILPPSKKKLINEKVYLISMKSNKRCWEVIDKNMYLLYINFLRILEKKQSYIVIDAIEKWMPDCGLHLIAHGISCFTQIKDLSAKDTVELFNICTKFDGFKNFVAMQTTLDVQAPVQPEMGRRKYDLPSGGHKFL